MQGGGDHVVGGLPHVHMIVGVHARAGVELHGPVGDNLIGVHIRAGSRSGLEDIQREMAVMPAIGNLCRCLGDGARHRRIQAPEIRVHLGRRHLDASERLDEHAWEANARDRKIFHRPRRLGPVQGVGRHAHLAHGIPFNPIFAAHVFPSFAPAPLARAVRRRHRTVASSSRSPAPKAASSSISACGICASAIFRCAVNHCSRR